MISFRNSLTLAATKLRTRRVRLVVTLIVSGLLLMVLVTSSIVIHGAIASVADFSKDRFSDRFFVAVNPPSSNFDFMYDPAAVKRAVVLDKALIAQKTAAANQLGIPYDPSTEPKPTEDSPPGSPQKTQLNLTNVSAQRAYNELVPKTDFRAELAKVGAPYGIKNIFTGNTTGFIPQQGVMLAPIVDGAEVETRPNQSFSPDPIVSFGQMTQALDEQLVAPLALKNADLKYTPGAPVPILAPVDAVEKLAGLTPLSDKAPDKEKLQRLKLVRTKAETMTFTVCYRNATAVGLQTLAKNQADEIARNVGKSDYIAPSLQYVPSTTPCRPLVIKQDKRTAEEKAVDSKTEQFRQSFGEEKPVISLITFRVVGVLPTIQYGAAVSDLSALLQSLVSTSVGDGWVIPSQAMAAHPVLGKLLASTGSAFSGAPTDAYYAEFKDRLAQKRFLDERSCQPPNSDEGCAKKHQYYLSPYGNPLATLYDGKDAFDTFLMYALIVIGGLTAIIMMGTIGKIIADSRKETSVFRALGANRTDIDQIYLLYAVILSILSFILALILGTLTALWIDHVYVSGLSIAAVLAFNSTDTGKIFHLFSFNALDMLGIFGFALATGLLSAIPPLGLNTRRNPIQDMREE